MPRRHGTLLGALLCALTLTATSAAIGRVPSAMEVVVGNPADRMLEVPIEDSEYDRATRCSRKRRPGVYAFVEWLERNAQGIFWGSYRCEKWGKREASLHAEGRAVDWHLDATDRAQKREAEGLILLLLAPDKAGNQQALARRMGVQEIIWDCGYWAAGMTDFSEYAPCFNKRGKRLKNVSPTLAHRDHIHFGITKAGAARRTSFWTAG